MICRILNPKRKETEHNTYSAAIPVTVRDTLKSIIYLQPVIPAPCSGYIDKYIFRFLPTGVSEPRLTGSGI